VLEDPETAGVLARRLPPDGAPRALSITEIVAPRAAYWRAISPVPTSPEREERFDLGRAAHRRLGSALEGEGALEVRVRRGEVVGRIDVLADVPIEVKTSATPVALSDLLASRPDQVEQLGMYAALIDRTDGRLVTLPAGEGARGPVRVYDLGFRDAGATRAEMERRVRSLRSAWKERDPRALPVCRWFGRGCEFQDGGVCGCTGSEPEASPASEGLVTQLTDRPDLASRLEDRLRKVRPVPAGGMPRRFRELLYPRRAYFERTGAPAPPVPFRADPTAAADLYERLRAALESGPLGEVARLPPRTDAPEEEVGGFRGEPFLLRSSRSWEPARVDRLVADQPQYALELGLRCVATGTDRARLVLGRERATSDTERVQVFEFRFGRPTVFARVWRDRVHALATALTEHEPGRLPACPAWMFPSCPYAAECGCGEESAASHR
jgi:hypothetical protein